MDAHCIARGPHLLDVGRCRLLIPTGESDLSRALDEGLVDCKRGDTRLVRIIVMISHH